FQALREPKVSVEEYASRIARYGSCAPGCLALSLVYLDRFLARHSELEVSVLNAHRLLLGCTLVAAKQWEDSVYRNAFWAKVGGVSCAEINLLERQLLRGIDFRLHVDKPEFDQYRAAL
ncbi:cyclin PHO80-like protein, partial [Baffinella frigidus]